MTTSGTVPPLVSAISNGVLRTMFLQKLTLPATAGLVLAFACLVGGNLPAQEPPKPAAVPAPPAVAVPRDEKKPQPVPKPAGPGTLLLAREGSYVSLAPDGKEREELKVPADAHSNFDGRLSPDGTRAAFVINKGQPRGPDDDLEAPWPYQVVIRKLGAPDSTTADFSVKGAFNICWSPDGKKVLVTYDTTGNGRLEHVLVDADTGKMEPFELPAGVRPHDWSRDGKTLLVIYLKDKKYRLGLVEKGNSEVWELTELKVKFDFRLAARFSPDGKKVLFIDADPEQKDAHKWHASKNPYVLDLATGKRKPIADFPQNASCTGLAWSPDGKRIAYTWRQLHPDLLAKDEISIRDVRDTEGFLIVADADGRNTKTIASGKERTAINPIFGSIDWR